MWVKPLLPPAAGRRSSVAGSASVLGCAMCLSLCHPRFQVRIFQCRKGCAVSPISCNTMFFQYWTRHLERHASASSWDLPLMCLVIDVSSLQVPGGHLSGVLFWSCFWLTCLGFSILKVRGFWVFSCLPVALHSQTLSWQIGCSPKY